MSLINRTVILEAISPLITAKRFRGKVNIQRPRAPHFERALFLKVAQPYYINPKKNLPLVEACKKDVKYWKKTHQDNPFQTFIANELLDFLNKSRLVAFFHVNPMNSEQQFRAKALFKKESMCLKNFGKATLEQAVKGTSFEILTEFYQSRNMIAFSEEPDIKRLLKVNKKFPQLILLAGIYEGRFVSKDELLQYSQIPSLQAAQSGLVHTLNSIGGTVVSQLQQHQNTFVCQLQERIKQLEEEKKE